MTFALCIRLFLIVLLAGTTACSRFHRDWRRAGKVEPVGIAGRWEGTWVSKSNGHKDRLRCLITPVSTNTFEAKFHAKYQKILSFGYTARLTGVYSNEVFLFSGEADLGKLAGGIYQYSGKVDSTNFFSTYDSRYDRGTFQMKRPAKH